MEVLKPNGPRSTSRLDPGEQGFDSTRERLGDPALLSMGAVGMVLLIACANLAGLLLARASARRRELAVRLSLGASRGRLIRQLLAECVLLAAAGGAASVAVSAGLMRLLLNFLDDPKTSGRLLVAMDPAVLAFTAALAGATVLAFGALPAWHATRMDVNSGLKEQPAGLGRSAGRLRKGLIVAQMALSLVLLFGAGALTRTLRNLQTIDLGFDPARVVMVTLDPQKSGYGEAATADLFALLEEAARQLPAVESAALAQIGALSGGMFAAGVKVAGHTPQRDDPNNNYNVVSPSYFRTLGIPLVAGRDFTGDDRKGAPLAAIVNEQFVKYYWPGQNALGRQIGCLGKNVEIVGVVRTAKYQRLREDPQITIYLPLAQKPLYPVTLHARTRANSEAVMARLRDTVRGLDPKLPFTATTLVGARDAGISRERLLAFLSSFLAVLAAGLVAIGLYGLIAYSVTQRTREIGLRLALGARPREIVWMFLRECLAIMALGIGLGVPLAVASARVLKSVVYGVPAIDRAAMAGGAAILVVVAALSVLLPSWRGSGMDPMRALRHE